MFMIIKCDICLKLAALVPQMVKNPPANTEYQGSVSGLIRYPKEGNRYLHQYSCLGNPMDRGAWWATVHGVAKETQLCD